MKQTEGWGLQRGEEEGRNTYKKGGRNRGREMRREG